MIEAKTASADGATLLYDARLGDPVAEGLFDAAKWQRQAMLLRETTGRGAVLVLDRGSERWVLRHYNRGGIVSRFVQDHYVWNGVQRSRAFREWLLLAKLHNLNLAVPRPIAARVMRTGLVYQADIITAYLPHTRPLSVYLNEGRPLAERWRRIGSMLRSFHDKGVDHPDLTAHNILLAPEDNVYLVDFDNARMRPPGRWQRAGLARLERSLRKVALETGTRFDEAGWQSLLAGYGAFSGS